MGVSRSGYYKGKGQRSNDLPRNKRPIIDEEMVKMIQEVPTYGYRRVWAILRFDRGISSIEASL
jgi:hypothetical protein